MKYGKIPLFAFGMSAAVILSGCSGKREAAAGPESETQNAVSVDSRHEAEEETESILTHKQYDPVDEVRDATALQPAFQMGSMAAYLGETTVAELAEEGAVLEPIGAVSSLDFEEQAGSERSIVLSFDESPFTVKVKNISSNPCAIKNSVITEVYADQGSLFSIGGIKTGDAADDLTNVLGEPYSIVTGDELADAYGNMSAYYYTSRWDDRNIIFFVENTDDIVVSFKEKLPANYVSDIEQLSDKMLAELIMEREKTAGEAVMKTPYLADVENSEYAESELSDIRYVSAKLYTLNEIADPETFNRDTGSISDFVPNSYLIIEFKASIRYREEELDHLEFLGQSLDPSYKVVGAFYVLNPYINEAGEIDSLVGETKIRNMDGVYVTYDALYEDIFGEEKQGYTLTDYSVSEHSLT